jgi:PKD repeat protein
MTGLPTMKTPVLAILTIFLTAAFAGCLEGDADPASTGTQDADSGDHQDANMTHDANATQSHAAPVIVVKILVNGTEVSLVNDSYPVPSAENVTFDASATEGDNLTFMWDFGDDNTSEEAVAVHAFGAAGNYTVKLMAHSQHGMSEAEFPIVAASNGPAPGTPVREEKKQFKGTVTQPVAEAFCGDSPAGMDNLSFKWEILPEADGTMVKIAKFTMKITQSTTNIDTDFYFNGPDGKEVGSSHGFEPQDGAEKGFSVEGEWMPGTYTVLVKSCGSVNNAITIDMVAFLVAA